MASIRKETTDVLPNEVAGFVGAMVEQGARVMKQTLESA
jgi:hypothetical protein